MSRCVEHARPGASHQDVDSVDEKGVPEPLRARQFPQRPVVRVQHDRRAGPFPEHGCRADVVVVRVGAQDRFTLRSPSTAMMSSTLCGASMTTHSLSSQTTQTLLSTSKVCLSRLKAPLDRPWLTRVRPVGCDDVTGTAPLIAAHRHRAFARTPPRRPRARSPRSQRRRGPGGPADRGRRAPGSHGRAGSRRTSST